MMTEEAFDERVGLAADLEREPFRAFVGDDGHDHLPADHLDVDLIVDRAPLDGPDGAEELVACTGLHIDPPDER